MATYAENLATARDNYATQLVELSDPARRKVSYSIGNRSVSWTEYQRFLMDAMKEMEAQLATAAAADGSADVVSAIG